MNNILLSILLLHNPTVIDGDTLRGNIYSIPDVFGKDISVRISEIDAPELHGKCVKEIQLAQAAKEKVNQLLSGVTQVELREPERDKYFRIVAKVYVNGISVGDMLLQEGLARRYSGQTKQSWC